MESTDIKLLIDKAKAGDNDSFAVLYESFFKPIYRFIYFKVGQRKEDAEDLAQTVFMKAFGAIEKYDNKQNAFSAWLYMIARNTVIDHIKKKKSVVMADEFLETLIDDSPGPSVAAEQRESGQKIAALVETLPEEQKEVISLKFFQDMSNREIAQILDKSEAAIRQLQFRGLKRLRELLGEVNI